MEEILKEIIQKNAKIKTALNEQSSEEVLKGLFDEALETQERAKSIGFTSSTAYDLLVYNIEDLKERLGIQEEKPVKGRSR